MPTRRAAPLTEHMISLFEEECRRHFDSPSAVVFEVIPASAFCKPGLVYNNGRCFKGALCRRRSIPSTRNCMAR